MNNAITVQSVHSIVVDSGGRYKSIKNAVFLKTTGSCSNLSEAFYSYIIIRQLHVMTIILACVHHDEM